MKQLLVFILVAALMCWFMFAPMYKHVIIIRQALLQKEVDYLLEVGANGTYGYIDSNMVNASKLRLEARGFDPMNLNYVIQTTTGSSAQNASQPVRRGIGIQLHITYPYQRLFVIDQLIGIDVPAQTDRMGASGMKMSEYVP
ncbi:hypothetical protein D3C73_794770 [compost metagenome]